MSTDERWPSSPGPLPVLALDIGQSGMRGAVEYQGRGEEAVHGPPLSAAVVNAAALNQLSEQICAVCGNYGPFSDIGIGMSGLAEDQVGHLGGAEIAQRLSARLNTQRLVVASDAVTGYLGSLRRGPGVVLTWGTGSVAIASDGHSAWRRADGRGPTLGDLGGGFWIGRKGLVAALDHLDGRGGSAALADRAIAKYGSATVIWRAAHEQGSSTAFVAQFAGDVVDADSDGDPIARRIVSEAITHVERTIRAASGVITDTGPTRVGLVGGLTRITEVVDALTLRLEQGGASIESVDPNAPLTGARRLLDDDDEAFGTFSGLVFTSGSLREHKSNKKPQRQ